MAPQRIFRLIFLGWFAAAALGLPLPMPGGGPAGLSGERFPCENCPCGCATAEHCWNDCCCHSLAERLAWARREGVRPPEQALAQAQREGLEIDAWMATRALALSSRRPAAKPSCPHCAACGARGPAASPPSQRGIKVRKSPGVATFAALACQGVKARWLVLGAVTLPRPVAVEIELLESEIHSLAIMPADSPVFSVPLPPPEVRV